MDAPVLFVGVGKMGGAIAARLLAAGVALHVHDANADSTQALAAKGAVVVGAEEIARLAYERVLMCLPTPTATEAVLGGWLAGGFVGKPIIIDLTTVSPSAARDYAARCAAAGGAYLDVPLSGGERGAQSGEMVAVASGDSAAFEAVQSLLLLVANHVHYVGDSGRASLLKAVNQYVYLAYNFAMAQGLAVANALGLPEQAVHDVMTKGAPAHALINDRWPVALASGYAQGFPINRCLKDLEFLELPAGFDRRHLALYDLICGDLRAALSAGAGGLDILALGTKLAKEIPPEA